MSIVYTKLNNTGPCCVGNLGSEQRFDYSVVGDAVNVAARLQELTKLLAVDMLLGEASAQALEGWAILEVDRTIARGKTQPMGVFGLLGDREMAKTDGFRALRASHQRLLVAYRGRQWDEAERALEECRRLGEASGLTTLYATYRQRIAAYRTSPLITPGSVACRPDRRWEESCVAKWLSGKVASFTGRWPRTAAGYCRSRRCRSFRRWCRSPRPAAWRRSSRRRS